MVVKRKRAVASAVAVALALAVAPSVSAGTYDFRDVTWMAGLRGIHRLSYGAVWEDYDGDGDPDLFVNRHYLPSRFFTNVDGEYNLHPEDFRDLPGYEPDPSDDGPMDRHACAWGEVNGDRVPELLCQQGADKGKGSGPNQLIFRSGDSFVDRASEWGLAQPMARGRSVNWLDFDGDGDLDVFLGNAYRAGHPNKLFRHTRDGFTRVRDSDVELEAFTLTSTWSDWDNDGDPDLLVFLRDHDAVAYENRRGTYRRVDLGIVTSHHWGSAAWGDFDGDGRTDVHLVSRHRSVIARNMGGRFRKVHVMAWAEGRGSVWFDLESDGDLDLFAVQGESDGYNYPDFLLVRTGGTFKRLRDSSWAGPDLGDGDSVVAGDSDNDGDVDLFVTNGHGDTDPDNRHTLLKNDSIQGGRITLRLKGTRFNPWGMGARIRVRTTKRTYRREVTDGVTHLSQSGVSALHLGLGSAPSARIKVSWPRGGSDCVSAAAGSSVVVTKGSSPC